MSVLKKELHQVVIALIPFLYLGIIYNTLPPQVPVHLNIQGEIDRFGSKSELILIAIFPLLAYLIFIIVPKKKIEAMGKKYQKLKTLLILLMTLLAVYILYSIKNLTFSNPNFIIIAIGILYTLFGNYSKTIKSNYFIGIRTPWTLKNETVWKNTDILGGKLWFVGGIIIIISSLVVNKAYNIYLFLVITAIITLIPVIYSYIQFKKLNDVSQS